MPFWTLFWAPDRRLIEALTFIATDRVPGSALASTIFLPEASFLDTALQCTLVFVEVVASSLYCSII